MSSLERFPSFDAMAFERDQAAEAAAAAASRREERNATDPNADPFAHGGVFGDGRLEVPWRFPSPYAQHLPLGIDDNARYAMGLPTRSAEDDEDDDAATTITPVTYQERRIPAGRDAGLGTELQQYSTPAPADLGSLGHRRVPGSLQVPKTRTSAGGGRDLEPSHDTSPRGPRPQSFAAGAGFRQSDPFVEKDPSHAQPPPLRATTLAYGLGPADERLQIPAQLLAMGGGLDPSPTREPAHSAALSREVTSVSLFTGGGEPGPGLGSTAQRRATEDTHFAGFDGDEGARDSTLSTSPPHTPYPLTLSRAGSIATVRDMRAMAPPHCQISIRSLTSAARDVVDRPIIVTNALNHVLYDGRCRHCEVNNCVCLLPSSPSPLATPAAAADDAAASFFTAPEQHQQLLPDNDIMTEGFCRHCVVNHCACVSDAKWGLHHAANALRNARLDEGSNTAARRLVSDSGTVRRYESTSTEAEGDGERHSNSALRAGSSSPHFAAPLPAYLPLGRERVSSADFAGFYDVEAQPRRDGSGGSSSSGRGMVSTFHFRHSFRAGETGQGSSLQGRRTKRSRIANFIAGQLCRIFVAVIFILLIAVMAWVIWFYTNRNDAPIT